MSVIYPLPRRFIRTTNWAQSEQRRNLQRAEWTGRTREAVIGPADRWSCTADIRPAVAADVDTWRAFQARMKLEGARCRVSPVVGGQNPNLVLNPDLALSADGWSVTASAFDRVPLDAVSPGAAGWYTDNSKAAGAAIANAALVNEAAAGDRLSIGCWARSTIGSTGTVSLGLRWLNSGGGLISGSGIPVGPSAAATDQWVRFAGTVTAPAGTASFQIRFDNAVTAGWTIVTAARVARLPERATVNGAGQSGLTLALSGLALSQRNLRAGQLLTVPLPSGDEQLIPLTEDLVANGSGNGTAQLGSPLRESPANGAVVELDRPWALMRALDPLGWGAQPGGITIPRALQLEESF